MKNVNDIDVIPNDDSENRWNKCMLNSSESGLKRTHVKNSYCGMIIVLPSLRLQRLKEI